tara:strand:- start:873 stop:1142 length:270 start_codon:yes stop_codon:yes gene_type:complete
MSKYESYEGEYIYEKPTWEYRSKNLMINDKSLLRILWIIIYIRSRNMYDKLKAWSSDFQKKYGEGSPADLDYGKLVILFLCIYIAVQVS